MRSTKIITTEGVAVRKCVHGRGVFSTRAVNKGERIAIIAGGKAVTSSSAASMYALKVPHKKLWWDEIEPLYPEWDSFLDHSENANAIISFRNFNPKKPKAKLIAIERIKRNEEIMINYREYGDSLYKAGRYRIATR